MKKNKIILVILLAIIAITAIISVTFSKYVIQKRSTHIIESDAFYFNSNLTQKEYDSMSIVGVENLQSFLPQLF